MSERDDPHLDEALLIRASVDVTDLPGESRAHLSRCRACRKELARLEGALSRIGEMAARMSPEPGRRIVLPDAPGPERSGWGWRPALGVAATVCVVALVLTWSTRTSGPPAPGWDLVAQEFWDDEEMWAEIRVLETSPLPPSLMGLLSETDIDWDPEFVEFVVPLTTEDTLSRSKAKRGDWKC